eukprot:gnl/MRDRNA2_/MRDRNA2_64132_c0_seq1.p1 gnl/MRDRNA2_/MRDRNA2_64132_c0~~gnl/MRDRNA2_/MRDRNA2_64132_c0_seq1.p1  ORF type:complete len:845 (+),score=119.37 gnl/MRDRNA2_/MRDRNA2_64132_c0_seq1:82-2616(+)
MSYEALTEQGSREVLVDANVSQQTRSMHLVNKTVQKPSLYRRLHEQGNTYVGIDHFTSRGHKGTVTCVHASEDVKYIATGSVDGTMRVWKYDDVDSISYQLFAVLTHEHGTGENEIAAVEAVHVAGCDGPAISGTSGGSVHFLSLQSFELESLHLHDAAINDLMVKAAKEQEEGSESWILFTASADCTSKALHLSGGSAGKFVTEQNVTLKHKYPVLEVGCIDHFVDGVTDKLHNFLRTGKSRVAHHDESTSQTEFRVVTLTSMAVSIWNLKGELKSSIRTDESTPFSGMAIASDASVILTMKLTEINIWVSQQERSQEEQFLTEHKSNDSLVCIGSYDAPDTGAQVEIDVARKYMLNVQDGKKCALMRIALHRDDSGEDCLGRGAISRSFVKPDKAKVVLLLPHTSMVAVMRTLVNQEGTGSRLLTGCEDGTLTCWDLDGDDAGETTAQLRSLKKSEVLKPIVLLLITFSQVSMFAFGPSIPWNKEVRATAQTAWHVNAPFDYFNLEFEKDALFWMKTQGVIGFMVLFIVTAASSLPTLIRKFVLKIQSSEEHKKEFRSGQEWGTMHMLAFFVSKVGVAFHYFILLASSLLVVPVFKACAEAVDCVHTSDGKAFVATAPQVECYQGAHMLLSVGLTIICPMYIFLLVPYAVVAGNAKFVQQSEMFSPTAWQFNAERAATVVYLGPMHPVGKNVFRFAVLDLFAKIILPVVVIETTSTPVLQMLVVSCIGFVMLVVCLVWTPLVDEAWTTVLRGSRIFTLVAMICGLVTAIIADDNQVGPAVAFGVLSIIIVVGTVVIAARRKKLNPERLARRLSVEASPQKQYPSSVTGLVNQAYQEFKDQVL